MTPHMKWAIGGVIVGLILLGLPSHGSLAVLVIAAAIAIQAGAYLMLDPSQRRRLHEVHQRRQLGN